MGSYRLTKAAEEDLIDIANYGDTEFGVTQSDSYRDKLKARFSQLADQPMIYPAVDHIRVGYRRSVCGVHAIYYRLDSEGVEIVRILKNQDVSQAL